MIEAVVALAMLTGGGLFLLKAEVGGWQMPALAYIVGTCLFINFSFLQIISGLPTSPHLTLILTVGIPLFFWLVERGYERFPYRAIYVVALLLVIIGLVYFFRTIHIVAWSSDSLRYLTTSALIAADNFESVTWNLLSNRLLAFSVVHAPANLAGEFYMRTAGPMLAISGIGLLIWISLNGSPPRKPYTSEILTIFGVLFLVTNNRMVWSAFALFPHLLTGVLVLMIAGCGWLLAIHSKGTEHKLPPAGLIAIQSIAIPALVITRYEGVLMVALAILPTLLCGKVPPKNRAFVLCVFGVSVMAWNLLLLSFVPPDIGQFRILAPIALAILGFFGALLLVWPKVRKPFAVLEKHHTLVLVAANMALWIVLAGFALVRPEILLKSVDSTFQNLLYGEGGWGYSLVIFAGVFLVLALVTRGGELIFLRFPVTSFIPLAFLLAYLREAGLPYRVGPGDSLNRMWIHILPLAVLFVVAAARSEQVSLDTRIAEQ